MIFEYDERKNERNQMLHKISFEEAAEIWQDPDLIVLPARKKGEKRQMAIGKAFTVLFSVVHTTRGDAVRIISARRSTTKEAKLYEQRKNNR